MTEPSSVPPSRRPAPDHSATDAEREQYRGFSARIERAYGSAAHSVTIDAQVRNQNLCVGLSVLNRSGFILSPKSDADLSDLIDQAGTLLGPGHWLLDGKRAKHDKTTTPRTGWKKHAEQQEPSEE